MVKGGAALHHLHVRKRIHQEHQAYPHPNPFARFIDKAVYFLGLAAVIISLPQVWKIWFYQDAAGVSLITWGSYLVIELVWMCYGFIHKIKPLILAYVAVFIVDLFIVIGTYIYG